MYDELQHIGTPRKSGRYPWGSGDNPHQHSPRAFMDYVTQLRKEGLTEKEIADGLGISIDSLRSRKSIARTEAVRDEIQEVVKLRDKGMSTQAIADRLGISEPTVRNRLKPELQERADANMLTRNMLRDQVDSKGLIDVGVGTENFIGVSRERLNTAIAGLKDEGYTVHYLDQAQASSPNQKTKVTVLAPPGTDWKSVMANRDKIHLIDEHSEDGGRSFLGLKPVQSVNSDRVEVVYGDKGGSDRDGMIELRRGTPDLDMGGASYAQVRIGVDGTHYIKGMAVYSDKLPDGVDIRVHSNKVSGTPLTGPKDNSVLKPMKTDPESGKISTDNPFGATIKPGGQRGALNILNEEGDWEKWSKTLPSQVLGKQPPTLAKKQLDALYDRKKKELDEINALTNPTIKKKLLQSFADDCDSQAVHLKGAAMAGQKTQVVLPLPNMKEGEAYAPQFLNGTRLVLVRFPHGGKFELPEVTVNNKNVEAKKVLGNAKDAIGIHPKVAARLSGADFDGDHVLAIPNDRGAIKTRPALKGLENFDPHGTYKAVPGMKEMTKKGTQLHMGNISNLVTDMTIKGASEAELARAVRHSMVVIDAEKHKLNYTQSAKDNQITALKTKYQGGPKGGASTLLSRASAQQHVNERKNRVDIDPKTGEKIHYETGATYVNKQGQTVQKTFKSTQMAETQDAFTLSGGKQIETVYATHANKLKALANTTRKEYLKTPNLVYNPVSAKTYAPQVATLGAKLNTALKNAPRERQAQLLAGTVIDAKRKANPDMDNDDLKKVRTQALREARARTGAAKDRIDITPSEWAAIQAGAITNTKLTKILQNTDLDRVKELATPRSAPSISASDKARAKAMSTSGATQAEIANALGVSTSTLSKALSS